MSNDEQHEQPELSTPAEAPRELDGKPPTEVDQLIERAEKAERERNTMDRSITGFMESMADLLRCLALAGSIRGAVEQLIEERDEARRKAERPAPSTPARGEWPPPEPPRARGSFNWTHVYNKAYRKFLHQGEHASNAHLGALEVVLVTAARRAREMGG